MNTNLLVIAPTFDIAKQGCELLGINYRLYAFTPRSAQIHLIGRDKPTVIMYCMNSGLAKMKDVLELNVIMQPCDPVIINLPEVRRVKRD